MSSVEALPAQMAGSAGAEESARNGALTLDLLAWVASGEHFYLETMESWRTSCPRLPIWEDAVEAGLIEMESARGLPMSQARVVLTPLGRAVLGSR